LTVLFELLYRSQTYPGCFTFQEDDLEWPWQTSNVSGHHRGPKRKLRLVTERRHYNARLSIRELLLCKASCIFHRLL